MLTSPATDIGQVLLPIVPYSLITPASLLVQAGL